MSPLKADEFVFGDFPDVENSKNSDSLDSLVLSHQGERTLRNVITPYFLLHCSKESNKEKARQIRTSTRYAIMQEF
ncbi:MAG: hypothetical protein ABR968_07595 [Bacteroidales bacterium]